MKLLAAEIFLFLILSLMSKGFVYGEQGCTEKFMELSQVTYRAQHTSASATGETWNDKIRALQEYQFNCSFTNITSLILGIDVRRATGSINLFPSVRVYRPSNDPGKYDLVTGSERTIYYSTSNVSTSGVFEYLLNPPILVMSEDVLAIVQPLEENSIVRVYYISDVSGISFRSSQEISISPDQIDLGSSPTTDELILVYPVTDGYCVNSDNSITPAVIRNNFLTIQSSGDINDRRQYLYPEIVFSCNGSVTRWIYGGEDSGNNMNKPELQIWRQLGPNNYNKIGSSLVNASTMIGTNLYEFIPQTPLQFQEGDIFGVHIPKTSQSIFSLYEQVGNGPLNERVSGNADNPYSTITQALLTDTTNDFPLVTVEVSISVASTSVASPMSTSTIISTTSVITTSIALTTTTISTTDNTIISSTVVSITPSSTSSVLVTTTPSPSVSSVIPPSTLSVISNLSIMSSTSSSSSVVTDTTPVSSMVIITTTAPSDFSVIASSMMTNTPSISSSSTVPPNSVSATSTGSSASSSSFVITGSTTSSSSSTDSTTSSSHIVTSSLTTSFSVLSNPSAGSGASTVIAVVISMLVLFIAMSVGIIIVLLLVMKKRKKRYLDCVTLLTASFSTSSTQHRGGGFAINNIVYEDLDETSGPVTYDHYETAPDVPQQRASAISNPLYGGKLFEAATVETAYETLISDKESPPINDIKVEGHLPDDQIVIYDELNNQSATPLDKGNKEPHYWKPGDDTSSIYQQMESKGYIQLRRNDIKVMNVLGSGEFGTVYEGTWLSKPVAIKTLKNSSVEQEKVKFLQEAAIMGQFHHPNIVKLHGMVTVGEPLMIVLELIPHGDMRQYLHTLQPQPGELVASTVPGLLLSFCHQIASGMEYLSKKGFVHRDLAARNILIADHGMCKIADFGMSRDLHDENYYVSNAKMIPIKWTSPEALSYKRYSSASDVWSYGVVLYEIWSLGHKPFENYTNQEYMKLIDTGFRLPPPPGCPRSIYEMMIQCWHPKTNGRPAFADIVSRFGSMRRLNEVIEREGTVLGGSLESAYDLYTDLQNTYTIN